MTRAGIQTLIDAIGTGTPNTALELRTVLSEIANGITGSIKIIDVATTYIATNFDPTGLGINAELGYAICNGNNGTRDWRGRVPMQYSTTYPTLGATGGSSTHTLITSEMPSHNHSFSSSAAGDIGGGFITTGNPTEGAGTFGMTNTGGGLPHNNMQPYIVTLFLMKL